MNLISSSWQEYRYNGIPLGIGLLMTTFHNQETLLFSLHKIILSLSNFTCFCLTFILHPWSYKNCTSSCHQTMKSCDLFKQHHAEFQFTFTSCDGKYHTSRANLGNAFFTYSCLAEYCILPLFQKEKKGYIKIPLANIQKINLTTHIGFIKGNNYLTYSYTLQNALHWNHGTKHPVIFFWF